jgi:hypothetical protein
MEKLMSLFIEKNGLLEPKTYAEEFLLSRGINLKDEIENLGDKNLSYNGIHRNWVERFKERTTAYKSLVKYGESCQLGKGDNGYVLNMTDPTPKKLMKEIEDEILSILSF